MVNLFCKYISAFCRIASIDNGIQNYCFMPPHERADGLNILDIMNNWKNSYIKAKYQILSTLLGLEWYKREPKSMD